MIKIILFSLFIFTFKSFSQEISGKLYGEGEIARYVKITNMTNGKTAYSNIYGDFKIKAILHDSLIFSSPLYEEKKLKIDSLKVKEKFVVQLKGKVNQLAEVVVINKVRFKEFDTEKFNIEFKSQLKEDIKKNPYFYEPQSDGRLDIVKASNFIGEKIGELFKGKKKKHLKKITYITFEDLEVLFSDSSFFNDDLIKNKLNISLGDKFLFFSFCEERKLDSILLKDKNLFLLLDELIKQALVFKKNLEEEKEINI